MKKNKTILILIISIITAVFAILVFIFFMKVIKNKNEHISAVTAILGEKMREKEESVLYAERIAEIKTLQSSINNYFINIKKVDTFVDYLEQIGTNMKSVISVKNIEIPEKDGGVISVKLLIAGTFEEVMNTVNYLENIPYQIDIIQVNLDKQPENNNENKNEVVKQKNLQTATWQADVSFNILSSMQ